MPRKMVEHASLEEGVRIRIAQMVYGFKRKPDGTIVLASEVWDGRVPNPGRGWRGLARAQATAIFKRLASAKPQLARRRVQQLSLFRSR